MVGRVPDCVPDASTICIPARSSEIQYGPTGAQAWEFSGSIQDPAGTEQPIVETHAQGATAQLSFNGTSIAVFGSQLHHDKDSGGVSYAVDSGPPTTNATLELQTSPTIFQFPLFDANGLSDGTHTLKITNIGSTFILTYFKVGKVDVMETTTLSIPIGTTSSAQSLSLLTPGNRTTATIPPASSAIITTETPTTIVKTASISSSPSSTSSTASSSSLSTSSTQSASVTTSSVTTSATGAASTGSAARARTGFSLRTVGVIAFGAWLVLGGLAL